MPWGTSGKSGVGNLGGTGLGGEEYGGGGIAVNAMWSGGKYEYATFCLDEDRVRRNISTNLRLRESS